MRILPAAAWSLAAAHALVAASALAAAAPSDLLQRTLELPGVLRVDDRELRAPGLRPFYRRRGFVPAWSPADRGAERTALVLATLSRAADHGLDPGDYHVDAIRGREPAGAAAATVERELLLTDGLLRYASDVRIGRVRPDAVETDWTISAPSFDAAAGAARAIETGTLATWLARLPPPHEGYARLVAELARYRAIAHRGGWTAIPPGPLIRPAARDGRVPALRRRLAAVGDLSGPVTRDSEYDVELVRAVHRFQARHGLSADGVVGPATRRALDVSVTARIQQIAVNLARWRWLPRELGPRYLAVNAASATLEVVEDGRVVLTSRAVVGDPDHPTPVLQTRLAGVVFNPPWTIPERIVAEEILPVLRRHPRYLADNEIVVLDRADTDPFGLAVDWWAVSPEHVDLRLQQRPGPRNPLGEIKFDVPNRFDVYLHASPATALFARPVRALSHGCVRVEGAHGLAAYALAGQPEGDPPAIARAIATGVTRPVAVARPLAVYLLYWTAFVEDGVLHFRDDVYGRDRRLGEALAPRGALPAATPARGTVGCPG